MTNSSRGSERILNVAVIASTFLALVSAVWRFGPVHEVLRPSVPIRDAPDWEAYARQGPRWGDADSDVTVVQFASFTCSVSANASNYIAALPDRFDGRVSVVFRHAAVMGEDSFQASLLAHCGDRQGMFRPVHDLLYERLAELGNTPWVELAHDAGVPDSAALRACMLADEATAAVQADTLAAARLGVRAIPTFLINDKLVEGFPGDAVMDSLIRRALEERSARDRNVEEPTGAW